jgi:hypothetical protein
MLIRGVVPAKSPEDALGVAKHDVFDRLVADRVFDYYVTADMDGRGVSGTDRWGSYPVAVPADGSDGRELIEDGWRATVDEYERAFDRIEAFLEICDRCELWEDEHTHGQYHSVFNRIGQYEGSSTFLYDQYGQGIRDRGHLDRVAFGEPASTTANSQKQTRYVVPADVHF